MKKYFSLLFLLFISTFLLTGCGSKYESKFYEDMELNHIVIDSEEYTFPNTFSSFENTNVFVENKETWENDYYNLDLKKGETNSNLYSLRSINDFYCNSLWVVNSNKKTTKVEDCLTYYFSFGVSDIYNKDIYNGVEYEKVYFEVGKVNSNMTKEEVISILGEPNDSSINEEYNWEQIRYVDPNPKKESLKDNSKHSISFCFVNGEMTDFSIYLSKHEVSGVYNTYILNK